MVFVVWRKKRLIIGWSIALVLVMACLVYKQLSSTVSSDKYEIRDQFPPLVVVPGSEDGPPVRASAAVLIEARSGAILFAKNAEVRRAPASTTKMMTAIVALEKGRLTQIIKVSRKAARTGGSSIWLKPGDRLSLKELLEGVMLRSGNDGSMAIAEGVSGTVAEFVKQMNIKAREIGALHTNFQNPHGLRAPSHYTTALDLALIARYGLENPWFAKLVKKRMGVLEWQDGTRKMEIRNTNRLLWYFEGADGVKTGTTNEAGHCLVASATRKGKKLVAVVLNSRNRWSDCASMLEYGFREFAILNVAPRNRPVCRIKIANGDRKTIKLYPRSDLVAVAKHEQISKINVRMVIPKQPIPAPVRPGQPLGKIRYEFGGKTVQEIDLIAQQSVKRKWWRLW